MPTLQVRRIYQSGKSSCAVTLPSGWLRYLGLRPGDEVEVIANGEITIRPRQKTIGETLRNGIGESTE
jgi:AbrB family looped-hinge helix DNA binding protein